MASIKNWFVRSERVKDKHNGIIKYGKYLVDANHPNHAKTSSIVPIIGNMDSFIQKVSSEAIGLDISNSQKKGGRPVQSYAQSFVFGLPPSIKKPTPDEWKSIATDILIELAKKLGISPHDLKGKVFANVHDQDNPHLNVVIPRIINGKSLKALDQKGTIAVAKKAFTASTLVRCGLDVSSYEPLQTNLGRKQAKWKLQEQKAEKAVLLAGISTVELNDKIKQADTISELSMELNNRIVEWIFAVRSSDPTKELDSIEEVEVIANKLGDLNIPAKQRELLDKLYDSAEEKAGKTLPNRVRYKI